MEDYIRLKDLSQGGQGSTCIATEKSTKLSRVIKLVACESIKAGNHALQEAKVLQSLNHPHVVRYIDVFLHQEKHQKELLVCTVMEYCENGDLSKRLRDLKVKDSPLEEETVRHWLGQLADAIVYVHGMKVLHRDMKPQNVFIVNDRPPESLRIGDFGLASRQQGTGKTSRVGTPAYLAPEMLQHEACGEGVDLWGLGCIALEMVTLQSLAERKGMLGVEVITSPIEAARLPPRYSSSLRQCIAALLRNDAAQRPDAEAVVELCQTKHSAAPLISALARSDRSIAKARGGAAPSVPGAKRNAAGGGEVEGQEDWTESLLGGVTSWAVNSWSAAFTPDEAGEKQSRKREERRDAQARKPQETQDAAQPRAGGGGKGGGGGGGGGVVGGGGGGAAGKETGEGGSVAGSAGRVARGKCGHCGEAVWTDQNRMKGSGGVYYHEACVQLLQQGAASPGGGPGVGAGGGGGVGGGRGGERVRGEDLEEREVEVDEAMLELQLRHRPPPRVPGGEPVAPPPLHKQGSGTARTGAFQPPPFERAGSGSSNRSGSLTRGGSCAGSAGPSAPVWGEQSPLSPVDVLPPGSPANLGGKLPPAAAQGPLPAPTAPSWREAWREQMQRDKSTEAEGAEGAGSGRSSEASTPSGSFKSSAKRGSGSSFGSSSPNSPSSGGGGSPMDAAGAVPALLLASSYRVSERWIVSTSNAVNLRAEPSLKSAILGQKMHGEMFSVCRRVDGNGGWVQLSQGVQGQEAWVRCSDGRRTLVAKVEGEDESSQAAATPMRRGDLWMVVCGGGVNVRDAPTLRARTLCSKGIGEVIEAYECKLDGGGWVRTSAGGGQGWVRCADGGRPLLKCVDDQYKPISASERWVVVAKEVNIRAGPSRDARILGTKTAGEFVGGQGILQAEGGWLRMREAMQSAEGPETGWLRVGGGKDIFLRHFVLRACDESWQVADAEPVKVRVGPSVNAAKLCVKEHNDIVEVSGSVDFDGGWLRLKRAPRAGSDGWMRHSNGRGRQFMRRVNTVTGMLI